MKKVAIMLCVALIATTSCTKKSVDGASGYTCTCHYRVQFTNHDTTIATKYPSGTTQHDAAEGCANMGNYYTVTYGDNTAHCGI